MADQVERKLTAILAADVAGYSRLMAADEEGTLARLKTHRRELIDPKIKEHRGRIIKTTGDGLLIEFASVVDAVRCAVDVQRGMATANAEIPPDRRIEFRAGINIGDVIVDGDDIYGDGVNIAARLENIADPGGIRVSANVRDQVLDKLGFGFADLGEQTLKNIARPVRVYAVDVSSSPSPPIGGERGRKLFLPAVAAIAALIVIAAAAWYFLARPGANVAANAPAHLSIVVLPFANLSNDPKQDYFADGITDNLTTDLSRIRNSFVIARNTAFTYKGKNVDAKEIGKELGVRYVLEGSVQRDGNRVRVNAQLIDAESGAELWADRFEEDLADLFKLQDDVVARLANTLGDQLVKAEADKSARSANPDAIDLTMRGWALMNQPPMKAANLAARSLFDRALKLDPDNDQALAGSAWTYAREFPYGWGDPSTDYDAKLIAAADRAIALNPNNAVAYYAKGIHFADLKRRQDALDAAESGLRQNPNYAPLHFLHGLAETGLGRYEQAKSDLAETIRLSPRDPLLGVWLSVVGEIDLELGRDQAAIEDERKSLDAGFHAYLPNAYLAAAYAQAGNNADASAALAEARRANPKLTMTWVMAHTISGPKFYEGLRKAGLPEDEVAPPKHLSIVVLPFDNLSGDPKQDYFADGITDNLTTDLSRIRNSFVIARNTAFTYKGKNVDARAIGKELGVRYVLEGSVQRDGNRVRVNAQLIDTESGSHLWADRFEEDLADLFKLQDDVVARLANTLGYELVKAEAAKSAHSTNPDAIDLTMQGWALYWGHEIDKAATEAARNLFARALKLDPSNDDALAGIAYMNFRSFFYGWGDSSVDYDAKVIVPADRAVALNPANAKAYYAKSIYLAESKRPNDALVTAEAGLGNDPNFAALHFARAVAAAAVGRYESARADIAQAMKLSPRDPQTGVWDILLGGVDIAVGNDNAAIEDERKALQAGYHAYLPYAYLASAYALLGNEDKAKTELVEAHRINPKLTIKWAMAHTIDAPRFYEGLRKAGLPEDEAPKLSIVVLPFQNLSGDAKQDYLADVLTDELTTYISRIPGSFVIARNTAFTYKGKPTDVKEIGKDLGVRYALEGSVQPTDKRIRTNAQLIDTETGAHLWAEEFDTDKTDLLQTEDEIVTRLARTLQIQLTDIEAARLERAHPANPDAQELALRCEATIWNIGAFGKQAEAGFNLCEQALEIDPNNVVALATLPGEFIAQLANGQSADRQADIRRADELASRALAIDPNSSEAHSAKAGILAQRRRFDEARAEAERAIALNPSQMLAYNTLCILGYYTGQPASAIACVDKAISLSPRDPQRFLWIAEKGDAYLMLGQDDKAVEWWRRAVAVNPNIQITRAYLAAALALTGQEVEARQVLADYLSLPGTRSKTIAALKMQANSDNSAYLAFRERIYEGLRKAGMPEQ